MLRRVGFSGRLAANIRFCMRGMLLRCAAVALQGLPGHARSGAGSRDVRVEPCALWSLVHRVCTSFIWSGELCTPRKGRAAALKCVPSVFLKVS